MKALFITINLMRAGRGQREKNFILSVPRMILAAFKTQTPDYLNYEWCNCCVQQTTTFCNSGIISWLVLKLK
jgi:hypothetical protein